MKTNLLFRWSSILAAMSISVAIATAIPYLAGASEFEGSAGYVSLLLIFPTMLIVSLAMRAWAKKLEVNTKAYRVTLAAYCVLSIPFVFFVVLIFF